VRNSAILTALFALAACAGTPPVPDGDMPSGRWTGHVQYDDAQPPVGILVEVREGSVPDLRLVASSLMGLPGGYLEEVTFEEDRLRFVWPRRERWSCALRRQATDAFEGVCTAPDGRAWPVRLRPPGYDEPPVGYAAWLLDHSRWAWTTSSHGRLRVYIPEGDEGAADIDALAVFAEEARTANQALLGVVDDRMLDLFLVADRAAMHSYVGRAVGGIADAMGSTTVVTGYGAARTVVVHELMHVQSHNAWGDVADSGAWLAEGLATYAAGSCEGHSFDQINAKLAAEGLLLPEVELVRRYFEFDDLVFYIQSAGLVGYLFRQYGREAVRVAWTEGVGGLERVTGVSFETLDADWRAGFAPPADDVSIEEIRLAGCG
jgi:hypothetical protein